MIDCRIWLPSFYAYCICVHDMFLLHLYFFTNGVSWNDEFSYLTSSVELYPLGLSFNQFGFYPHIYRFILPFSRSLVTNWLMTLPTCYTPCLVSLSDKSVDDRFYKERLPNLLLKRYLLYRYYVRTEVAHSTTHIKHHFRRGRGKDLHHAPA